MKKIVIYFLIISNIYAINLEKKEIKSFINKMHNKYGFSRKYIIDTLKEAKFNSFALNRYNGVVKNATDYSWSRYKNKILIPQSIKLGKEFMKKNSYWLNLASKRYKVNKEIITAFIRVESKFGLYGNEFRVIDVLTTLAFNPNRKKSFFKKELENLFIMAREANVNILKLRGSFAGAIGYVQQMPSIYLKYAVDLDRNGDKNPNSMADAIGSIAKFLSLNGWKNYRFTIKKVDRVGSAFLNLRSSYRSRYSLKLLKHYGIQIPSYINNRYLYFIRLRDKNSFDIFIGDKNYRIITFYNPSKQYATSIALYAKKISQ